MYLCYLYTFTFTRSTPSSDRFLIKIISYNQYREGRVNDVFNGQYEQAFRDLPVYDMKNIPRSTMKHELHLMGLNTILVGKFVRKFRQRKICLKSRISELFARSMKKFLTIDTSIFSILLIMVKDKFAINCICNLIPKCAYKVKCIPYIHELKQVLTDT